MKKMISTFVLFCFVFNVFFTGNLVASDNLNLFSNSLNKFISLKTIINAKNLSAIDLLVNLGNANIDPDEDSTSGDIIKLFRNLLFEDRKNITNTAFNFNVKIDETEFALVYKQQKPAILFRGQNPLKIINLLKKFINECDETDLFRLDMQLDLNDNFVIYLYSQNNQDLASKYNFFIKSRDLKNNVFRNFFSKKSNRIITISSIFSFISLIVLLGIILIPFKKNKDTSVSNKQVAEKTNLKKLENFLPPTQNIVFDSDFLDKYEMFNFLTADFNIQANPFFVRSYPYCGAMQNYAFTYDQALFSITMMSQRNFVIPKLICDKLLVSQKNSEGLYYSAYSPVDGSVMEWNVDAGYNAWVAFNFLHYADKMNGIEDVSMYILQAKNIVDALINRQDTNGAIFGDSSKTWKSTEHNIDTYLLFDEFYKKSNDSKYLQARDKNWQWISKKDSENNGKGIWNVGANRFNRGENQDEYDYFFSTDTTSFGILAVDKEKILELTQTVDKLIEVTDAVALQTVLFNGQYVTAYDYADSAWANWLNPGRLTMVSGE